jgi:hypothetical protein
MLTSIFESTIYLDDNAVVSLGTALTQLSFTVLANMATLNVAPPTSSDMAPREMDEEGLLTSGVSDTSSRVDESAGLGSTARGVFSAFTSSLSSIVGRANMGSDDYRSIDNNSASGGGRSPLRKDSDGRWTSGSSASDLSPTSASASAVSSAAPKVVLSQDGPRGIKSRENLKREIARMTYRSPPFALEKLVDTALLNVFRIDCVWDMTHTLLSTVVSKHDDMMRIYAVRAMERIVTKSLTSGQSSAAGDTHVHGGGDHTPNENNDIEDDGIPEWLPCRNYENELMEPFVLLMQQSVFLDARLEALEGLFRIVSNAGDRLRLSWPLVLRAVLRVLKGATSGTLRTPMKVDLGGDGTAIATEDSARSKLTANLDAQHILSPDQLVPLLPKAGQVIQLVLDNHFEMLDGGSRSDLVQCVRLLGEQTNHVNLSLSAVQTLFFAVCDNVERERSASVRQVEPGKQMSASRIATVQREAESVWMNVFGQLRRLSLNIRPEVRNSAIATLCSVLKTCAPHLGVDAWR